MTSRRTALRSGRGAEDGGYEHLLEFEDVSLSFKGVKALDGVSFTVDDGELFAVIGPNGAGKTSIFNCINGVYKPQEGSIRWKGEDIWAAGRTGSQRSASPARSRTSNCSRT